MSVPEARRFAHGPASFSTESKRAFFVIENPAVFGTLRAYQTLRDESDGHLIVTRSFTDACEHIGVSESELFNFWPELEQVVLKT